ncbi:MAG: heme-binding protein [Paracoccaceae bacterium]|nr:heme-binding protein [Paracoccaceae bacterium]
MTFTKPSQVLTHTAVMTMLSAAISEAEEHGQPQCIIIVDASGETLGEIRMSGAKFLSRKSARSKALTAASIRAATTAIPESVRQPIGMATDGNMTGLPGGLPIFIGGECIGAIGVGSGTGDQDVAVATAALKAIGAAI